MAKTKKNLQKKRRLQKKTRGFGKGNGANSASNKRAAAFRRHIRDRVVYEPTTYTVILGDDGSEFKHEFQRDPSGPKSDIHYELYDAIKEFRNLESRNIPTLNIWDYEVKYENDEPYVFVPKSR